MARRRSAAEQRHLSIEEQAEADHKERLYVAMNLAVQVATGPQQAHQHLLNAFGPEIADEALKRVAEVKAKEADPDWRIWAGEEAAPVEYSAAQLRTAVLAPADFDEWKRDAQERIAQLRTGKALAALPPDHRRQVSGIRTGVEQYIAEVGELRQQIGATREARLAWYCDENRLPPGCPEKGSCAGQIEFEGEPAECPLHKTWGCPVYIEAEQQPGLELEETQ